MVVIKLVRKSRSDEITMPSERRRAMRWARATLQSICEDPIASPELRSEAVAVLAEFPDDRDVATCFLGQDDEGLAQGLTAVSAAQELFQRARCSDLSGQTQSAVAATCRHFPQSWEMSGALWSRSPRAWVEFYLLRDLAETSRLECTQVGAMSTDAACVQLGAESAQPS